MTVKEVQHWLVSRGLELRVHKWAGEAGWTMSVQNQSGDHLQVFWPGFEVALSQLMKAWDRNEAARLKS